MIEFYACIFTEENMYDIKKHKNNLAAFIFFNTTLICIVKLYLKKTIRIYWYCTRYYQT